MRTAKNALRGDKYDQGVSAAYNILILCAFVINTSTMQDMYFLISIRVNALITMGLGTWWQGASG